MMDYTLFGESHGEAVGVLLKNVPAGMTVDHDFIAAELLRRAPRDTLTTSRHEEDEVEFLSGVFAGKTTGMPLVAIIRNRDGNSADYESLRNTPRPGHADYAAHIKGKGCRDYRGGGHFSGRLTAPLVVAGAIAKTCLQTCGVEVHAEIVNEEDLRRRADRAKAEGDSVGGQIRCTVAGLPAGLGGPAYDQALESEISRHVFAIPAVKAIGFGAGEAFAEMRGSEGNDGLRTDGKNIFMLTNNAGGINGGISNGMPLTFTVTFRPTPSIAKEQQTVDLETMTNTTITVKGRHDACIVLRAVPVVEAATALALCQLIAPGEEDMDVLRARLDAVDIKIVESLGKRLELAKKIGEVKREQSLPIYDAEREEAVLRSRGDWLPERRSETERLFRLLMELSREEQEKL